MTTIRPTLVSTLILLLLAAPALAATLVVDDNNDSASCGGNVGTYGTIGAAVEAAGPGDLVLVCPGTYTEQVAVTTSDVTLKSQTPLAAVVKAPASMAAPGAIVGVNGASGVAIVDFTITGPGGSSCASIRYGIRVDGGGSATITGNKVQDIRDDPFGGCQNGIGILVGRRFEGQTGAAIIEDNEITGYQKGGIVVDNAGSTATITNNVIVGAGPTKIIAQNGLQVSRGATATITGNEVRNNFYLNSRAADDPNCPEGSPGSDVGSCLTVATGILVFGAGQAGDEGQLNSQNTLRRNQTNTAVIP